jgi:hypothetical protein
MKIFYSWQDDLERKRNRWFIKGALEKVVRQLNAELSIEQPDRQVTLDHDTKGVPGTPDLASTIFDKIAESTVFVADVSFIAERVENNRKLCNPNVLIELGYAFSTLGSDRVVCVMNITYGKPDDLPFDLRHKRHPVQYSFANADDLKVAKENLVKSLKTAIDLIIQEERYKKSESMLSANTVQGWIDNVVRPSLLSLRSVKKLLTQDKVLTWQNHGYEFNAIPRSEGLVRFAQDTLAHFTEHHPDVEVKLALYDQQRAELSEACRSLHKALMANPILRSIYEKAKTDETEVNGRTIASDFGSYTEAELLDSLAESIVNRRPKESYTYTFQRAWKRYCDDFLVLRDLPDIVPESERVDRAGEHILATVEELILLMSTIGKRLAEKYNTSF